MPARSSSRAQAVTPRATPARERRRRTAFPPSTRRSARSPASRSTSTRSRVTRRWSSRVIDVVNRAGAADRTLLASFRARTLRKVRRLGYPGKTGLAQSEVIRLLALPVRALSFFPLRGAAAQIPYRVYGIDLGTRAVVNKCHALGLEVHYWTVNEPALATRLLDVGADAIMTDDPRAIAPVLEAWRRQHEDA